MPNALEPGGSSRGRKMIVAGGGTGGHLFPGIAVAQAFTALHHRNRVLFINAGRPFERDVLDRLGWPREIIPVEGLKGRGFLLQARALFKIPLAIWRAWNLIKDYAPDVVFGVGGYSAGPVVVAAWMQGVRTALHEQNQLPGLTNRLLRRIVDRNYLTFEDASGRFDARKTLVTGNPVRDEILALGGQPKPMEDAAAFNVLILGGSQGAQAINKAMVEALPMLEDCAGLKVVHQTGIVDESWVRQAYAKAGIAAVVQSFFEDVADRYQRADLIVCRAGATTVAEITAIGRAALFIPFPFAADDHQTSNARALVEAGAAEMIAQPELSGEALAQKIEAFAQNRSQLTRMAARARSLGRPEAALTIVHDLCMLMDTSSGC